MNIKEALWSKEKLAVIHLLSMQHLNMFCDKILM